VINTELRDDTDAIVEALELADYPTLRRWALAAS
jgi:hypothetical protein